MKIFSWILSALLCITSSIVGQTREPLTLKLGKEFIAEQLGMAGQQILFLANVTPADKFPRTFEHDAQKFSGSSWWCSGFYPGTLLYLYEGTGNKKLLTLGLQKLEPLAKEKNNKGTHDLGFMLYCSFGNGLRLTGDSSRYKDVLISGASSLASRFSPITKTIRSWDHKPWHYPVIIDNMMNLEFLTQLTKVTGDRKLYDVAVMHANTTLKNHFRKDYSSYHVIDYDGETRKVLAKKTHQGAFHESA